MFDDDFVPGVNLRNIDLIDSMANIATQSLVQFYSRDQLMQDFSHLFDEYFKSVFLLDLENYFVPMIKNANRPDIDIFFIKCSFFMKSNKAFKPEIVSRLHDTIVKYVGYYLNENGMGIYECEFYKAITDIFWDISNYIDLSTFFEDLKNKYESGNLNRSEQQLNQHKKLKTNISVPELVLLFRSLDELKPDIFQLESKEELFSFIATNFETKASSSLSAQSIKNNFYKYDEKAKGKWTEHFSTLRAFVFGLKEK
jgi:hypothetical protein